MTYNGPFATLGQYIDLLALRKRIEWQIGRAGGNRLGPLWRNKLVVRLARLDQIVTALYDELDLEGNNA